MVAVNEMHIGAITMGLALQACNVERPEWIISELGIASAVSICKLIVSVGV